jgi:hypothetical protein
MARMLDARSVEVKVFLLHSRASRPRSAADQEPPTMPKDEKPNGMAGKRGAAPAKKTAAKKTAKKTAKKR